MRNLTVRLLAPCLLSTIGVATAGCSGGPGDPVASTSSDLSVSANEKTAYEFFVGKGLKDYQSAGIVGNLKHEGYVPTPEAEAVHQRVARGEITTEEAIKIFRDRALKRDTELTARKRRPERA